MSNVSLCSRGSNASNGHGNVEKPVLFSSWRSSCSWRVRTALALKGIDYEYRSVSKSTPDNFQELKKLSPTGMVPVLKFEGHVLTESLAIVEFLDERFPDPPLLPKDLFDRAKARSIALQVACTIQPLQVGRVLDYVDDFSTRGREEWAKHWLMKGIAELEVSVRESAGKYAVGDRITIADLYIPSILFKARMHQLDVSVFPTLTRVDAALAELPAFKAAHAQAQPDAPDDVSTASYSTQDFDDAVPYPRCPKHIFDS